MRLAVFIIIGVVIGIVIAIFSTRSEVTAFVGVNVIPMDRERTLDDQTVLVKDGVIITIGRSGAVKLPRGAKIIKGDGRYLLPGLADMHTHIYGYNDEDPAGSGALPQNQFLLYAATGVTFIRDMAGAPSHFQHRQKIQSGEWIGPDFYFTSPLLEGQNAVWSFSTKVTKPDEAVALIGKFAEDGYWGIKIYHTLSADVFDAIMAAGKEYSIPVVGHVPFDVGINRAIGAGMYGIEHLRGYDFDGLSVAQLKADGGRSAERFGSWLKMSDERMADLVSRTIDAGVWNAPTLSVNRQLYDAQARAAVSKHPRFAYVHPTLRQTMLQSNALDAVFSPASREALKLSMPRMGEMVKRLNEAGGHIVTGTDAFIPAYVPGFTPIDEIESFIAAGMSNYDALRSATIAPAQMLGIADKTGTVVIGKTANLILVDGNPLNDITALWRLEGVMLQGRWFTFEQLEAELAAMAEGFVIEP